MAQNNYFVSTTALSTSSSGVATIGSGNVNTSADTLALTFKRTGLAAGELNSGSQTWTIHYVISAMTTPYSMHLRLRRANSGGTVQSTSSFGTSHTATGTYDDNITWDSGTWNANDQLWVEWWHSRPSGSGNKNGTMDDNGSSYVIAPSTPGALTQTASDDLNNYADAVVIPLGLLQTASDNALNFADGVVVVTGIPQSFGDDLNNYADDVGGDLINHWTDGADLVLSTVSGGISLSVNDSLNLWADDVGGDVIAHWKDSVSTATGTTNVITLTAADDMNHLTDGTAVVGIIGYDVLVFEDLNLWADRVDLRVPIALLVNDNLANWVDEAGGDVIGHWSDSVVFSTTNATLRVSDNALNLADGVTTQLLGGSVISLVVADNLGGQADGIRLVEGYRFVAADSMVQMADAAVTVLGATKLVVADALPFWLDGVVLDLEGIGPTILTVVDVAYFPFTPVSQTKVATTSQNNSMMALGLVGEGDI